MLLNNTPPIKVNIALNFELIAKQYFVQILILGFHNKWDQPVNGRARLLDLTALPKDTIGITQSWHSSPDCPIHSQTHCY